MPSVKSMIPVSSLSRLTSDEGLRGYFDFESSFGMGFLLKKVAMDPCLAAILGSDWDSVVYNLGSVDPSLISDI